MDVSSVDGMVTVDQDQTSDGTDNSDDTMSTMVVVAADGVIVYGVVDVNVAGEAASDAAAFLP